MSTAPSGETSQLSFLWWLLPLTVIYLVFELAFSARLLDTAGGISSNEELNAVEFVGKTLSGCALALFLIGTPLLPIARRRRWRHARTATAIAITVFASIVTAHIVEQGIIDRLVERASGAERQVAVWSSTLRGEILADVVILADLGLTPDTIDTPEGKAMLALLPLMAAQVPDLDTRLGKRMPEIVREHLRQEYDAVRFHNEVYRPGLVELRAAFARYGSGAGSPIGLEFTQFLELPEVQRKWREAMAIEFDDFHIAYATNHDEFERLVYGPLLDRKVHREVTRLVADPNAYIAGGRFADLGRRAKESVIVPPVALTFSLIGGVTLAGKTAWYLLTLLSVPRFIRVAILSSVFVGALWFPFQMQDPITTSPTFQALFRQAESRLGALSAYALVWVIRVEGAVYPWNERIRRHVLGGMTFGYRGASG